MLYLKNIKKKKEIILNFIGVYFLILGILAIVRSLYNQLPYQILYACYIGIVLIEIGILTRKSFIILSQIYILAIPLLVWDIDFFHWLVFNTPLWGVTDYFFFDIPSNIDKFVTLQHLYTIPLAIYATKLIGVKTRDAWKWSVVQLLFTFVIIMVFSPYKLNINCVFYSCLNITYGLPYIFAWFLISFAMVGISALVLDYFLWPKKSS